MNRLLMFLALGCCVLCGEAAPVVVGYLPEYRIAGFAGELEGVTDLVLFSLTVNADGTITEGPLAATHQSGLTRLRRAYRGRVLLTVGGWERSAGFTKVTATAAARKAFINRMVEICRSHRLSGIDFDWEHPEGKKEIAKYAMLIRETKKALAPRRGLVTVAQAGWQDLGKDVYTAVDRVHLMAYDHPYPQATFEKAKADVDRLIGFGCPREKIALGLPFYGRNKAGAAKAYTDLKNDDSGYAYNSAVTIRRKVGHARRQGLAGVMVWELGQDAMGEDSLLAVIRRAW